jgi:hypothetical protein
VRKQYRYFLIVVLVILIAGVAIFISKNRGVSIDRYNSMNQFPKIRPDYCGTVIPPNIAPLNFLIKEKGVRYYVKIHSKQGTPIEILSRTPKISIPEASWHELLSLNHGQELYVDIFVEAENKSWNKFQTVSNKIANEEIDAFLVYRKIHPSHNTWSFMGLYQRDLQNFKETPVLKNDRYQYGCAHCHTFCNNSSDKISISTRSRDYKSSLLIVEGDKIYKIVKKFGFTAWHPSGRLLALTINYPPLVLHANRNEMRDIVDIDSWIGLYYIDSEEIKTIPQLSRKDWLENYPTWSPDGRYLYFCNAKMLWTDTKTVPPEHYQESKYSLYRISYDIEKDQWGEIEAILLSKETGLSMNQPRVSPDGRWLTFSMCDYSCWPSYHPDSDLYILDLKKTEETRKPVYRKMEINSDECESWHTWSSNSRWIVFSSKKENPLFNRTYITYVDENGKLYKAFVVPHEDPTFYDSYLMTYTIPELVTEPVKNTEEKLARVIRDVENVPVDMAITGATPKKENRE